LEDFVHFEIVWKQTHYIVNLFKLKLHIHAYDWDSITLDTENIKQTSIETVKNVVWVMFVCMYSVSAFSLVQ